MFSPLGGDGGNDAAGAGAARSLFDGMSQIEVLCHGLTLMFWIIIVCFGVYALNAVRQDDSILGWLDHQRVHDLASAWMLIVLAAVGLYVSWVEIHLSKTPNASPTHSIAAEMILAVVIVTTGCFVAAGPWSEQRSAGRNELVESFAILTWFGSLLLAVSKLVVACLRERLRGNFNSSGAHASGQTKEESP
mmetsp:Transcript_114470/g.324840  ORF Transcript_114470/g.324840 Transcript_114470/m.324840 type:complete len:191 (-) Transcript_114470:183-755(-)